MADAAVTKVKTMQCKMDPVAGMGWLDQHHNRTIDGTVKATVVEGKALGDVGMDPVEGTGGIIAQVKTGAGKEVVMAIRAGEVAIGGMEMEAIPAGTGMKSQSIGLSRCHEMKGLSRIFLEELHLELISTNMKIFQ